MRVLVGCDCGGLPAWLTAKTDAMCFLAPIPDSESRELQRSAVRPPSESICWLRTLQEAAVPMNALIDAGASFGAETLQYVDENAWKLVFAETAGERLRERRLGAPLATFVSVWVSRLGLPVSKHRLTSAGAHA